MKYYITMLLALFILLTGCNQESSTQLKKEERQAQSQSTELKKKESKEYPNLSNEEKHELVLNFFNNEVNMVKKLEEDALETIASVSGENNIDQGALLTELVNNKIPAYEAAIEPLEGMEPQMKELETVTTQMKLASKVYLDALNLKKAALEKQDVSMAQKANEKLTDYLMIVEDYRFEIEELSERFNIEYRSNI